MTSGRSEYRAVLQKKAGKLVQKFGEASDASSRDILEVALQALSTGYVKGFLGSPKLPRAFVPKRIKKLTSFCTFAASEIEDFWMFSRLRLAQILLAAVVQPCGGLCFG